MLPYVLIVGKVLVGLQSVPGLPSLFFFSYILARDLSNHGVRGTTGRTCLPHLTTRELAFWLAAERTRTNPGINDLTANLEAAATDMANTAEKARLQGNDLYKARRINDGAYRDFCSTRTLRVSPDVQPLHLSIL